MSQRMPYCRHVTTCIAPSIVTATTINGLFFHTLQDATIVIVWQHGLASSSCSHLYASNVCMLLFMCSLHLWLLYNLSFVPRLHRSGSNIKQIANWTLIGLHPPPTFLISIIHNIARLSYQNNIDVSILGNHPLSSAGKEHCIYWSGKRHCL